LRVAGYSLATVAEFSQSSKEPPMIGKVNNLRELFEIELKYAYDCEQKLVRKGIPTMIENAGSPELKTALEHHLRETQNHVARLEQVFAAIGKEPDTKGNDILDKILSAAKDSISNIDGSPLRDSALVANGNQVEHYEIATYGTLAAFARHLGLQSAVSPLEETLKEEKAADAKLTQIGETLLNPKAAKYQTA
jgi:ferritin-like metal-binding protein YciE